MKESNDIHIKSMMLGTREAQQMQEIAQANQDAAKAVADFVMAHQLHPEAMSEDMYEKELAALKAYFAERNKLIQQNQDAENAIRGDMDSGWQKGIANFMEETADKFEQGRQLAESFTSGFSDAFAKFVSGAQSAKEAFGSFVDDLFQQALRIVANQALAKLLGGVDMSGNGSGGWLGALGSLFGPGTIGSGLATGGMAYAGSFHPVNERGPEIFTVNNRDYLAAGNRDVKVTPITQSSAQGATVINVAVQPTSTRQTAFQAGRAVATAIRNQQARA